ncbi:carboxymuconolactone decarboxylase family protein [Microbacterium sp.]|uniref:carboxymuconolactone decarboxylase family protein n=1 Tax=Microbacterium sp. TaxID=51671 RepID=UPI0039E21BCB
MTGRSAAPELYDAVIGFGDASAHSARLEPKVAALVALAVRASACTLSAEGIDHWVAVAMAAGATAAEVADVLASIAPLGNHAVGASLPVLLEVAAEAGQQIGEPELTAQAKQIKDEFVAMRGYWTDGRERLARYLPGFFASYMELSAAPWKHGVLEGKVRELMMVAIDASVAHMYTDGVRLHARMAMQNGATLDELIGALEIAATLGVDGFVHGMRTASAIDREGDT